jgi:hypothetical protein
LGNDELRATESSGVWNYCTFNSAATPSRPSPVLLRIHVVTYGYRPRYPYRYRRYFRMR